MNISRRNLLLTSAVAPLGRLLGQQVSPQSAQNGTSATTFSTNVKVVNVLATVRDKKGQIVHGLTKDDFDLVEENRPQVIRYFSAESDLPLTLGLLVDTSGSQRRVLNDERDASYRFFDQVLREDRDQAFVIHFDHEIELLQELTNSRKRLEKSLDQLAVSERPQQNGGSGYPGNGRRGGQGGTALGGTALYDAILLASDEVMQKQKERKALILLTDGVDNDSKTTLLGAIRSAQKSDTIVYSVLFADPNGNANPRPRGGLGGPGMGRRRGPGGGWGGGMGYPRPPMGDNRPDGKKVLEQIARETGGRFFQVSSKMPIDKVYAEIQEELRHQYNLGYSSDQTDASAAYRHIHVTCKKKDLIVQTREGYYAS